MWVFSISQCPSSLPMHQICSMHMFLFQVVQVAKFFRLRPLIFLLDSLLCLQVLRGLSPLLQHLTTGLVLFLWLGFGKLHVVFLISLLLLLNLLPCLKPFFRCPSGSSRAGRWFSGFLIFCRSPFQTGSLMHYLRQWCGVCLPAFILPATSLENSGSLARPEWS